jgi:hypothetical protein
MAKGILRSMGKSFRLGNSPKLQKRFISRKTLGARKGAAGFKKFMGASNKTKGRFLRSKVNANKNVKFAKKFFKKSGKVQRRWIRRKASLLKRKAAEKALEGGKAVLKAVKGSVMKPGFNPLKFIMMVFAGWLVNQLPKIIEGIKKFIDWAKPAFEILGKVMQGIWKFMKWIGGGLVKLWTALTGGDSELETAKAQLETKNKDLKDTLKKQEKGFDDLKNKAKGEETNLKKDMDDLDKEVKDEASGNGEKEGTTTSTNSEGKEVASTTSTGDGKTKTTTTKSTPKTKLVMERVPIRKNVRGGGSRITGYRNVEITVDAVTGEEISRRTVKSMPKNTDVSGLKKETTGHKVVTLDIPIPMGRPAERLPELGGSTYNQGNSDGVNSKKEMLTAIDS